MKARTVRFLRISGIALAIIGLLLLWCSRDAVIDGKELIAFCMLIGGGVLVVVPRAEEPYVYTKRREYF